MHNSNILKLKRFFSIKTKYIDILSLYWYKVEGSSCPVVHLAYLKDGVYYDCKNDTKLNEDKIIGKFINFQNKLALYDSLTFNNIIIQLDNKSVTINPTYKMTKSQCKNLITPYADYTTVQERWTTKDKNGNIIQEPILNHLVYYLNPYTTDHPNPKLCISSLGINIYEKIMNDSIKEKISNKSYNQINEIEKL